MAEHTPGMLSIVEDSLSPDHDLDIRGEGPIVSGVIAGVNTKWHHEDQRAEQRANAARIVACWNACEKAGLKNPEADIPRLMAARAELLAACEGVVQASELPHSSVRGIDGRSNAFGAIRAAIAKATGKP